MRRILLTLSLLLAMPAHGTFVETFKFTDRSNPRLNDAATRLANGDLEGAEQVFQAVLKRTPESALALLGLADVAYQRGESAAVKSLLERALAAAPDNAAVQTAWGRYQFLNNDLKAAGEHFRAAIELDPQLADPEIELAAMNMTRLNDPKTAAKHYARAVKLQPDNDDLRYGYASALSASGRLKAALAELDTVARRDPKNAFVYQLKGTLLAGHGQGDHARLAFNQALAVDSELAQAHWAIGELDMAAGKRASALAAYQSLVTLQPDHAAAHARIGLLHQLSNNFADAEAAYQRALKADPELALAYNNLAFGAAAIADRANDALVWARKAVALQPHNPEFLDTLAFALEANERDDEALQTLQKLAADYPDYLPGRMRLGRLLERNNDPLRAMTQYQWVVDHAGEQPGSAEAKDRLAALSR